MDTTGPAAPSRSNSIESDKLRLQPKRYLFVHRRPVSTVFRVGVGLFTTTIRDATAAGGTRPPGTGKVHFACWGSDIGRVPISGWLKPGHVKLIVYDRGR